MKLHWTQRVTDAGEPQWESEALGVCYVVTGLLRGSFLLTMTDLTKGTVEIPLLLPPMSVRSEKDAKEMAQRWYEKSLGLVSER
jgi:hypothetical protein